MAVGFDVATESHAGTTGSASQASFTWNHTGGGSARAALVFVFSIGALTDTSVTYGGTTMTAVPYTAADTDTEPGSVRAYFLDNCGTGTKAVVVNRTNNAIVMYAVAFTVTAATATEVYAPGVKTAGGSTSNTAASSSGTGTGTLALLSIDDGSPGSSSLRFMGRYQGTSNVTAAGSGSTAGPSIDFGLFVIDTFYETTPGQGARNVGGATITDDVAAIALAVRELAVTNAAAGNAAGTGDAFAANATVAATGGLASGTGTAFDASVAESENTNLAQGTGAAAAATVSVQVNADVASGTGTALAPTAKVSPSAENAGQTRTITGELTQSGSDFSFGRTVSNQKVATSFTLAVPGSLHRVDWYPYPIGSPSDDAELVLTDDNGGEPGTAITTIETVAAGAMGSLRHVDVDVALSAGTYWLVAGRTGSLSNADYFLWIGATGSIGISLYDGSSWSGSSSAVVFQAVVDVSASGTAYDATVTVAEGGVSVDAELASGSGTAYDITTTISGTIEAALGTGAANQANANIQPNAESTAGTGAAVDIVPSLGPTAGVAAGTGSAGELSSSVVTAGTEVASGSATAGAPAPSLSIQAGAATGTGAAYDPTVSVSSQTYAQAEAATGTGSAYDITAAIATNAEATAGLGAGHGAHGAVGTSAASAEGSGFAYSVAGEDRAEPSTATGSGSAYDATVLTSGDVNADAGVAAGTGQAYDATTTAVSGEIRHLHGPPLGAARVVGPAGERPRHIPRIRVAAQTARGKGVAYDAAVITVLYDDPEELWLLGLAEVA